MKTIKNISFGLFKWPKCSWYRNFKDVPILFQRIFFTLKHGYTPAAQWETFPWFIEVMKEVLSYYRYKRVGTPVLSIDDVDDVGKNAEAYNKILDEMLQLLNQMDDDSPMYLNMSLKEKTEKCIAAKDKFFKLFAKYFYYLWD